MTSYDSVVGSQMGTDLMVVDLINEYKIPSLYCMFVFYISRAYNTDCLDVIA